MHFRGSPTGDFEGFEVGSARTAGGNCCFVGLGFDAMHWLRGFFSSVGVKDWGGGGLLVSALALEISWVDVEISQLGVSASFLGLVWAGVDVQSLSSVASGSVALVLARIGFGVLQPGVLAAALPLAGASCWVLGFYRDSFFFRVSLALDWGFLWSW